MLLAAFCRRAFAVLLLVALASQSSAPESFAAPIRFHSARSVSPGILVQHVIAGDVNGDGRPDAVFVSTTGSIVVLFGDGAGGFSAPVAGGSASLGTAFAAADLDADGRLDLVTAVDYAGQPMVAVHLGTGAGFAAPVLTPTDRQAMAVAVGDLDGDGLGDLVLGCDCAYGVATMRNSGAGGFEPPVTLPSDFAISGIVTADANGDGRRDIVVTGSGVGGHVVASWLNHGASGWAARPQQVFDWFLKQPIVADFDGDGKLDVACLAGAWVGERLVLARGNGEGDFGVGPSDVRTTDGRFAGLLQTQVLRRARGAPPDVAAFSAATEDEFVAVFANRTGSLQPPRFYGGGSVAPQIAAADLDGDGDDDIVAGQGVVMDNLGNGRLAAREVFGGIAGPRDIAVGDLNGDGREDLVTVGMSYQVLVHTQQDDGYLLRAQELSTGGTWAVSCAIGDLDGDALPEIVAANRDDPEVDTAIQVYRNLGVGMFTSGERYGRIGVHEITLADWDLDGDRDVVFTGYVWPTGPTEALRWLQNLGAGDLAPAESLAACPYSYFATDLATADLDGNGRPDFALPGPDGVTIFLGDESGGVQPGSLVAIFGGAHTVRIVDLNHDGILDLAMIGGSAVHVAFGQAGGGFGGPHQVAASFPNDYSPADLVATDLDADGHPDLAVSLLGNAEWTQDPWGGGVLVMRNLGNGAFGDEAFYSTYPTAGVIVSGDFDMDGAVDLAVSNVPFYSEDTNESFSLLWNAPEPAPTPVLASNVLAEALADRVRLAWQLGGDRVAQVALERSRGEGRAWEEIARLAPDGSGRVAFEDRDVVAGGRYGYRLRFPGEAMAEVWVTLPQRVASFAIKRAWPNPVEGSLLRLRLASAVDGEVELRLMDVAGREVARWRRATEAGVTDHELRWIRAVPPGVYLVEARQGASTARARVAVIR